MAARRIRRSIGERASDFLTHAYPLDRASDQRFGDLLGQLCDERDRRASRKAAPDASN